MDPPGRDSSRSPQEAQEALLTPLDGECLRLFQWPQTVSGEEILFLGDKKTCVCVKGDRFGDVKDPQKRHG